MESSFVKKDQLQLEYFVLGSGTDTLVCLHGHGREVKDFLFLQHENRKLILLVLPFHGNSHFPVERIERNPLSLEEFNALFSMVLEKEGVHHFHFVAFSQGGRFVLSLIPLHQEKLQSVHLISPDGMDHNSFYNRSSRKKWARRLLKSMESNPGRFIKGSRILFKIGLIRPKVFAFIQEFSSDKETFQRASRTWRCFRSISPDLSKLKSVLEKSTFRFVIIMGKYDQVIRTRQAENFLEKIDQTEALIEIECGHNFFKEDNIPLLEKHIEIKKAPQ